jgi:hypothetical protein
MPTLGEVNTGWRLCVTSVYAECLCFTSDSLAAARGQSLSVFRTADRMDVMIYYFEVHLLC